jgi:EAL domain-containing protein (putative c-di-GMP-specific phosphodiesterase class I)
MSNRTPRALILDDDEHIAAILAELVGRAGYEVAVSTDPAKLDAAIEDADPGLVLIDLQMPGLDGVETLRVLAEKKCTAAILIVTGMDQRTMQAAEEYGRHRNLNIIGSVQKPFSPAEILAKAEWARGMHEQLTVGGLDDAIQNNELLVYYQPTIRRFADGSWDIEAAEALLRWNHPQRGLLGPDAFLEMGEDGGLARAIADYVLQRGVEQLRAWRNQNFGIGLRVNISAQLIADLSFPDRLETLLLEYHLDPSLLTLEITETAMLEQHHDTIDILTRLRLKEIHLAIDDFGIGHSSLTQLFRMPFSEMKIDKSLVMNSVHSNEAKIMVETLVGLSHRLGLTACAEGVESVETLEFLNQIGCDSAQGFLISKPIAAASVPQVLRQWPKSPSNMALAG